MNSDNAIYEAIGAQSEPVDQFQQDKLTAKELAVKSEVVWKKTLYKIMNARAVDKGA